MIRIKRSTEPPSLVLARATRLATAIKAYNAHGAPSKQLAEVLTGYDARDVKKTLYLDQHKKCAWCERRRDFSSSPVEHYRPKNGACRTEAGVSPRRVSPAHYWWLTWTWDNLLFACPRCNDAGHKANYFLLAAGTTELATPLRPFPEPAPANMFDASTEQPLLLDPAQDSFLDHVRWVPSSTHLARKLWTWSPTHLTERGRATITVLKLAELTDEVTQHLVDNVLQGVTDVEQHMRGRRTKQAADRWQAVIAMLAPARDFTAATWCALRYWVSDTQLAQWQLAPPPRPM